MQSKSRSNNRSNCEEKDGEIDEDKDMLPRVMVTSFSHSVARKKLQKPTLPLRFAGYLLATGACGC